MFQALTIIFLVGFGLMMIASVVLAHRARKTLEEHRQALDEARARARKIARQKWTVVAVSINKVEQASCFPAWVSLKDQYIDQITLKIYSSHEWCNEFSQLKAGQNIQLDYSDHMLAIDRGGGK